MPLPIVQEIDDAMNELVQWKVRIAREATVRSKTEAEAETFVWSQYPITAQLKIHRLVLSPVCYSLIHWLPRLVPHYTSTWSLMFSIIFILIIFQPANRLVPFQQLLSLPFLIATLPILTLNGGASALSTLDAFGSPIISHALEEISDREAVHYLLNSILLWLASGLTTIALRSTGSLLGTVIIGAGAALIVEITTAIIIVWYIDYIPRHLLDKRPRPPFQIPLIRKTCQSMVFSVSYTVSWWLAAFPQLWLSSREDIAARDVNSQGIYNSLPSRHIRLIKIHRGRGSQEIRCEFVTIRPVSMSTNEPYEAVSYVWGDPTPSKRIFIDGKSLWITESAYNVLLRRRSMWRDRLIWIDQVCINQDHFEEKTAQVQMMRDIFGSASVVTAWLGYSADAHLVQSLMSELYYLREGMGWSLEQLNTHYLFKTEFELARWDALANFIRNPWFRRVWIIQEATVAKKLHIIYGNTCMDWTYVSRGLALLWDRPMLACFPHKTSGEPYSQHSRRELVSGTLNADTMMFLRRDIDYNQSMTLSWLLDHSMFFESSDPRDRIFALLGLATDSSKSVIIPDYTNTTRSVYIKTMGYLLYQTAEPLKLLYGAGIGLERKTPDLPSWIPDWSFTSRSPFGDMKDLTNANKSSIRLSKDLTTLYLDGKIFDEVEYLSSVYESRNDRDPIYELVKEWLADVDRFAVHARDPYHTGERRSEALFRTIVGNHLSDGTNDPPTDQQCREDYAALKRYLAIFPLWLRLMKEVAKVTKGEDLDRKVKKSEDLMLGLQSQFNRISYFIGGSSGERRFCVTKEGRMGLVPKGCEIGDLVCIFTGSRVPFLLRQETETKSSSYELVGSCYIHGVMDGKETDQESKEIILV